MKQNKNLELILLKYDSQELDRANKESLAQKNIVKKLDEFIQSISKNIGSLESQIKTNDEELNGFPFRPYGNSIFEQSFVTGKVEEVRKHILEQEKAHILVKKQLDLRNELKEKKITLKDAEKYKVKLTTEIQNIENTISPLKQEILGTLQKLEPYREEIIKEKEKLLSLEEACQKELEKTIAENNQTAGIWGLDTNQKNELINLQNYIKLRDEQDKVSSIITTDENNNEESWVVGLVFDENSN